MKTAGALLFLSVSLLLAWSPPSHNSAALSWQNATQQLVLVTFNGNHTTGPWPLLTRSMLPGCTNLTAWRTNFYEPNGYKIRDPSHIKYQGQYYLAYNTDQTNVGFGIATSGDDLHWNFIGYANSTNGPNWSPKWFTDETNALRIVWRHSVMAAGVGDPTNIWVATVNLTNLTALQNVTQICTNLFAMFDSNTAADATTCCIVWNGGYYYLFSANGPELVSATLASNNWTVLAVPGPIDYGGGPFVLRYKNKWYWTGTEDQCAQWAVSNDLTNWSPYADLISQHPIIGTGLNEGTFIVERVAKGTH
jgi:hypothetical protein